MAELSWFPEMLLILATGLVVVSLFQRLRVDAIVGYLAAGALIGNIDIALITKSDTLHDLAELGVVFLLFMVGLELPLKRLRLIGRAIVTLSVLQVTLTTVAVALLAMAFGVPTAAAFAIGLAVSLSSTAIVLRMLSNEGQLTSSVGRSALAVLLIQDLAVGPAIAFFAIIGNSGDALGTELAFALLKMALAVVGILFLGRLILERIFDTVAALSQPELFAALALTVVLSAAFATHMAGLSHAFGAFLAGMLLADSTYRHQVAADIQPFRQLLLSLFFITVGMTVELSIIWEYALAIIGLSLAILLMKGAILYALARICRQEKTTAISLGLYLAQCGEFGFVIIGVTVSGDLLSPVIGNILTTSFVVTMAVTPVLAGYADKITRRTASHAVPQTEDDASIDEDIRHHIIIAGFGRVGTTIADSLKRNNVPFLAVDNDPRRVALARQRGYPISYGDASRAEVLAALHADNARAVIVAMGHRQAASQAVALLKYILPELPVYARAVDQDHAEELKRAGAMSVVPELVATGERLADAILIR